ncbi:hypothetical protein ACEWY4_015145 [Coilia grayii]|uniref:Uncharacterized protein n=1 Tax=Coilia grayii TaxID=363190 RepID=A0ABD1JND4_9TELE
MEGQRLTREDLGDLEEVEELLDEEQHTPVGATAQPESEMAALRHLLERTLKAHEHESYKQELRWRSVQLQLNQLREDVEAERRPFPAPVPAPAPVVPAPAPAPVVPAPAPAPVVPAPAPAPVVPAPAPAAPAPVLPVAPAAPMAWSRSAIPKLEDGDDIEQYLTTFERLATAYRWPREDWAVFLVPYLTGKARNAYVAMGMDQAMDYNRVKEAILLKYEISEEVYWRRFREPDIRPGETPRELYTRLRDLFQKWIRPSGKTVEEVSEVLILEQFLRTLDSDIRVWVKERNPQDGQGAAELVENYLSARRGVRTFRQEAYTRPAARGKSEGFGYGGGPKTAVPRRMPVRAPVPAQPRHDPVQRPDAPIVCYHCKQEGHIKPECPHRKPKYSSHSCIPRPGEGSAGYMGRLQTMTVTVNGNRATALLDSGSTQTLIQPHLLEKRDYIQGRRLKVLCVNGDEHDYPVADVYLEVQGQIYQVTVGVVERLSHSVVIGQDIGVLPELLQCVQPVNLVMTRAQCKAQAQEKNDEDDTNATDMPELAFAQADITPPARVKPRKTRRQRRQARLVGSVEKNLPCVSSEDDWGELTDNFGQLQRDDGTLKVAFERATHDGATAPVVTDLSGQQDGGPQGFIQQY